MVGAVGAVSAAGYTPPVSRVQGHNRPEAATGIAPTGTAEAEAENKGQPSKTPGVKQLTPEEEKVVQELKQRDAEVRRHEAAHMAAGGGITVGGASFQYQQGPDGKSYAVGGEVHIDTSKGTTPEQTIQKMQAVRRAALAPADPSSQDRSVAAAAAAAEAQARAELAQKNTGASDPTDPQAAVNAYQNKNLQETGKGLDLIA